MHFTYLHSNPGELDDKITALLANLGRLARKQSFEVLAKRPFETDHLGFCTRGVGENKTTTLHVQICLSGTLL